MSIQQSRTVSADVVHLEFELTDLSLPFIGLSLTGDCKVELEEMLSRRTGGYRGFYSIKGGDPAELLDQAAQYPGVDAAFLDRTETGGLLELSVSESCPVMFLAERRACPRRVTAVRGVGQIVAKLLAGPDEQKVVNEFLAEYPGSEFLVKRQESQHTPMFSHRKLDGVITDLLTDRQLEALQTAFDAGYYEWPREQTGEDLAAVLGITPPTFAEHLRTAERKLLGLLVD